MIKSSFHVHTNLCDGKDSVEILVESAIQKGFDYLGFSAHSYIEGDDCWTLKKDDINRYINEVLRVKEKYKNQISIFLGIEQDTYSTAYDYDFDYIIGSMHSIEKDDKIYSLDYSEQSFKNLLVNVYQNDFDRLCKDYFNQLKSLYSKTKADIVGHFDLVTKFIEVFNLSLPEKYLEYAKDALESIIKDVKLFEINTGAMASGRRSVPYPSIEILQLIYAMGGKIVINSDCHKRELLDFGFNEAQELAQKVGYKEHYVCNGKKSFVAIKFE